MLESYARDTRNVLARLASESRVVRTACGPLECASSGNGPAVLISHGTATGFDQGLALGRLLGTFRRLAVSRPGHLRTPLSVGATPEAQADAYAALLDLFGIQRAAILALSGGTPSALQFALRYPDRCSGLVIVSGVSRLLRPLPLPLRAAYYVLRLVDSAPWLARRLVPTLIYRFLGTRKALLRPALQDPRKRQLIEGIVWSSFPIAPRRAGLIADVDTLTHLPSYPLNRLRIPALVIHGTEDPIVPFAQAEWTANVVPGATLLAIVGGGHLSLATHIEQVEPAITAFLGEYG